MTAPLNSPETQALVQLLERARAEHGRKEEALFAELVVDLADHDGVRFKSYRPGQAFGLVFPSGAAGTVLQLQGRGIGFVPRFAPGDTISGFFEEVQIRTLPTAPASGKVTLLVVFSPFGQYAPAPGGVVGAHQQTTYTQVYNSAFGNVPSSPTSGISLEGVKGFQASVELGAGGIVSGDVRLWTYNAARGAWAYTETLYTPTPGSQSNWNGPGEVIAVPGIGSRIYAEAVSLTAQGGATTITMRLETFG